MNNMQSLIGTLILTLFGLLCAIIWKVFTFGFHVTLYWPVSNNYLFTNHACYPPHTPTATRTFTPSPTSTCTITCKPTLTPIPSPMQLHPHIYIHTPTLTPTPLAGKVRGSNPSHVKTTYEIDICRFLAWR